MNSNGRAPQSTQESLTLINQVTPPGNPDTPRGTAASIFALWMLIPLSLGALAYVLLGLWLMLSSFEPDRSVDPRLWILVTLAFQSAYWVFLADRSESSPLKGLWALIPFIALIPTFPIARKASVRSDLSRRDTGVEHGLDSPASELQEYDQEVTE